jgi:hypothetical protein
MRWLHVEQLAMRLAPDWWKQNRAMLGSAAAVLRWKRLQNANDLLSGRGNSQYPFNVYVTGQVEYPEDDPIYGTYVTEGYVPGR